MLLLSVNFTNNRLSWLMIHGLQGGVALLVALCYSQFRLYKLTVLVLNIPKLGHTKTELYLI